MIADKATAEGGTDVSSDPIAPKLRVRALSARMQALVVASLVIAGAAVVWAVKPQPVGKAAGFGHGNLEPIEADAGTVLSHRRAVGDADGGTRPAKVFRSEHVTEGKIAVDEDRSTPIFSPYAGRVTKLFVKPGDIVTLGPAAVHGRSDRHGAGAERLHHRLDRAEQSPLDAQPRADQRQAAAPALRGQGRPAQGSAATPRARSTPPRTMCAPPMSRWKPRATGCAFSARPTRRSPNSRPRARSTRPRRSTPRSAGRSCSARSDRGNMSAAARAIRSSSSAICRPSGW